MRFFYNRHENWTFQMEFIASSHITPPLSLVHTATYKIVFHAQPRLSLIFHLNLSRTNSFSVLRTTAQIHYLIHINNTLFHSILLKPTSWQFFHWNCNAANLFKTLTLHTENSIFHCSQIQDRTILVKPLPKISFFMHRKFKVV